MAEQVKHTPGPWVARKGGWGRYSIDSQLPVHVGKRNSHSVCQIALNYGAVTEANAHLIAAAPELYAVLKSMEAADDDPMANGDPRREKLLAAIAKAEGRS